MYILLVFVYPQLYPYIYSNDDPPTENTPFKEMSNLQTLASAASPVDSKRPTKTDDVQKPIIDGFNFDANKKRSVDVFADSATGHEATHQKIVLKVEDIRARRQQMKVIEAMRAHHMSMQKLSNFGDERVQTMLEDYVKPKSVMRERKLSDLEAAQLMKKPDPFLPDGALDERTFHFANEMEEYEDFIEYEQQKANRDISRHFYKSELKPFLRMPNLSKCGWMRCSGCGNFMMTCHDVVFGAFCVYECIKYCQENDNLVSDTAVKKVFLDMYNRALAFYIFREKNWKVKNAWIFPPLCMQDNSYAYILFWFEWIVQDLWTFGKKDGEEDEDDKDSDDEEAE